ncbi:MAG: carbon starvation CstA family protein [Vicinamibacterales bacterium]
MNLLAPVVVAAAALLLAFRLYPRYIGRVFKEDDRNVPPSERLADGTDYVKSKSHVVFGHHFATIAGAGPIVGPTLALAFGWQPVWLWVVIGGIFFGAVHDMSAMFMSVREGGQTIGAIARRVLGPAGYVLNLVVLIFVLTIINAIFLNLAVTALTSVYPMASLGLTPDQTLLGTETVAGVTNVKIGGIAATSVFIITAFSPVLGWLIRRDRLSTFGAYALALTVCAASVVIGFYAPITLGGETWRWLMAVYVLAACALPVWLVLQPRDFTNVQILYGGMALIFVSVIVAGFSGVQMQAPAAAIATGEAALKGAIWPILFITVACGAISGFHSLVASGTTAKQIPRESDARRIGYGAMVFESFLAILVIAAVGSMLSQSEYMSIVYPPGGLATNPILGFALGAGRLINLALPFIPVAVSVVLALLMLAGFVVTTLDSAVRLCRYLLQEFWQVVYTNQAPAWARNPAFNSTLAVILMVLFAISGTVRQMWPVFGAGNQLIGSLALTTVTVWLVQRARDHRFVAVPAVFMVVTTTTALFLLARTNLTGGNAVLGYTSIALMILSVGVAIVGVSRYAAALRQHQPIPMESAADLPTA